MWYIYACYKLRVGSFELRVGSFELRVGSYELRVRNYELRVGSYELEHDVTTYNSKYPHHKMGCCSSKFVHAGRTKVLSRS